MPHHKKNLAQTLLRAGWIRIPRSLRRGLVSLAMPNFRVATVGIVRNEEGRLLCVRHVFRPREHPWGLPAGFMQRGEQPEECLAREVYE